VHGGSTLRMKSCGGVYSRAKDGTWTFPSYEALSGNREKWRGGVEVVHPQVHPHVCSEGTVESGELAKPSARVKRLRILQILMEHQARTRRPKNLATNKWTVSSVREVQSLNPALATRVAHCDHGDHRQTRPCPRILSSTQAKTTSSWDLRSCSSRAQ